MPKTIYVIEDMENLPRKRLFTFLGIDWLRGTRVGLPCLSE